VKSNMLPRKLEFERRMVMSGLALTSRSIQGDVGDRMADYRSKDKMQYR
jgi:hypothetical protein